MTNTFEKSQKELTAFLTLEIVVCQNNVKLKSTYCLSLGFYLHCWLKQICPTVMRPYQWLSSYFNRLTFMTTEQIYGEDHVTQSEISVIGQKGDLELDRSKSFTWAHLYFDLQNMFIHSLSITTYPLAGSSQDWHNIEKNNPSHSYSRLRTI